MENEKTKGLLTEIYEEIKNSKIVFIEKSISKILKAIAENDEIYNLIGEKILGFNFEKELASATSIDGQFFMPENKDKIISLVFCLLNEMDNNKISPIAFIETCFKDSKGEGYNLFVENIIHPFIHAIEDSLGVDEHNHETEDDYGKAALISLFTEDVTDRMKYIINEVLDKLETLKKVDKAIKNDVTTICFCVDLCLVEKEFLGVFGLFSGLKSALKLLKKFKNEINEIDLLLDVLNNL